MRVKPDGFPLSSRYARALYALARPFAHVSRELRYPVHGSLLTKTDGGLLNAPPGNCKPAYIPVLEHGSQADFNIFSPSITRERNWTLCSTACGGGGEHPLSGRGIF